MNVIIRASDGGVGLAMSAACLLTLIGLAVPAWGQSRLYDDFSQQFLNAEKWGGAQFPAVDASGLEVFRLVRNGELFQIHRIVGETSGDTTVGTATSVLRFRDGEAISAIQFDLRVQRMLSTGCSTPGGVGSTATVRSRNILFSDGLRDVDAVIDVFRLSDSVDPPNVLRIEAFLAQSGLPPLGVVDLGMVTLGDTVTLRMAWLPDENRVEFQRDLEPPLSVSYVLDDSGPRSDVKDLELLGFVANCTVGSRPFVFIIAAIDNVFVDP